MSGKWSEAQRAKFAATTARKRAEAAARPTPPEFRRCGKVLGSGNPCRLPHDHETGGFPYCRERIRGPYAHRAIAVMLGMPIAAGLGPAEPARVREYRPLPDIDHAVLAARTSHLGRDIEEAFARLEQVFRADTTQLRADLEAFGRGLPIVRPDGEAIADPVLLEAVNALRSTVLRIEDRMALLKLPAATVRPTDGPRADEAVIRVLVAMARRLKALEAKEAVHPEMLRLLRRIDSRPARIIEYRPDHRRERDGGIPVRAQRARVGLPKRGPRGLRIGRTEPEPEVAVSG